MLEATELWVDTSVPTETQALFKEAKTMCEKWEAKHKVCKDNMVQKAQEEAVACKVEEAAWVEDEERVEVVNLPKEEAAPVHEEKEKSREPMPATKPAVKPAAPKR